MFHKKIIASFFFTLITSACFAQIAKDVMFGGSADLIKSDNDGFFEKAQAGTEVNYFISRSFTGTAGIEAWTDDGLSAVIGFRWYPINEAFFRFRGMIGVNDISIGGGWAKPLSENWKFEAIADLYFEGDVAIRAGFSYLIRRKPIN